MGERKGRTSNQRALAARKYPFLLRIIRAANDRLDPASVIGTIMNNIQKLIPCEAWSILLLSKDQDELMFERARGIGASELRFARVKVGEGVAGWVAKHRKPTIVHDVGADERFDSKFDKKTQFTTRSILCAPLLSRNQVLGVVELINKKSRSKRFTKRDEKMLLTLLGPIAVSLHNALLFREIQQLVVTDDLTRLYNNRYVNQVLAEMIERHSRKNQKFSVIFLDLDGFKSVNDQHGHLTGGKTLVQVGKIIFDATRKEDIVARYGGDEFVIILPNTNGEKALEAGEQIRNAIRSHNYQQSLKYDIRLSASLGVSTYPDHGATVSELIQKADNAMYRVKYSGKDAVQLA